MADDKPFWNYWLNLAEVPLEAAVCLSLDFNPNILKELKYDERYLPSERIKLLQHFTFRYRTRLDAANTHIKAHSLKAKYDQFKREYHLDLADFRQWGEHLPVPFDFPEQFPKPKTAPVALPAATNNANNKPLNPKREKTLLRIIRALDGLAELPERGAAKEVVAKLQGLGFNSPDDDTVRDVLNEARNLEAD